VALALLVFCAATYIPLIELNGAEGQPATLRKRGKTMNIARSFNSWRKYRQTVTELDRMSNRELHDLGIDRSDIRRVARQAVGF